MTDQITLEEALKLVKFKYYKDLGWQVCDVPSLVHGNVGGGVIGNVKGSIGGEVDGHVYGAVRGDVGGDVEGNVYGKVGGEIDGRKWAFIETPKDKLERLITESGNQELIDTFNQLEDKS